MKVTYKSGAELVCQITSIYNFWIAQLCSCSWSINIAVVCNLLWMFFYFFKTDISIFIFRNSINSVVMELSFITI